MSDSVKKQWEELDQALSKEIKRCERLLRKYADGGAAHTADFFEIKSAVKRAKEAIKEKSLARMALSYTELFNIGES